MNSFDSRRKVNIRKEFVSNVSSSDFPGHYPGENHSWDLSIFTQRCHLQVQKLSGRSIEFDLEGVDASIANAIRRVLIAEVPTVAIEHIYIWDNDSVIQDEVLAARLGLVPLNINPRLLSFRSAGQQPTDVDTVVFKLEVECQHNEQASKESKDSEELYTNSNVFSSQITWVPHGDQANMFRDKPPAPTNPNIILAKLRPGQKICMDMHAIKGIGSEHAKWSPVATASYRLLPHIRLTGDIPSHLCHKFASCFSPGVVEIIKDAETGLDTPKIVNPRNDTVSREVLRHSEFEDLVELSRIKDYFLFNVESEGPYTPQDLLPEAITVLKEKIRVVRDAAARLFKDELDDEMDQS